MSAFRAWHGAFRRQLADRLEQLQETLAALKSRLRAVLADVVGRAVSDGVRDAVHTALAAVHGVSGRPVARALPRSWPARETSRRLEEEPGEPLDPGEGWGHSADDDADRTETAYAAPRPMPRTLSRAVSAGLVSAFWLLPRCGSLRGLTLVASVALAVTGLALWAPALAKTGLDLLGSALPL